MEYRQLGSSDLIVSSFSLGAMTFGRRGPAGIARVDPAGADALIGKAIDAGINLFDTADIYNGGDSEILLGEALGPKRASVLIATKVGLRSGKALSATGLSGRHIADAIDASLQRLGTDWVDIYFAHRIDPLVPLEETLSAFDAIVRAGKARHIGFSNWPAWLVAKAIAIQRTYGWAQFVNGQVYYSLLDRDVEHEIVPCAVSEGFDLTVYSPLAMGRLTGKYSAGQPPQNGRLAEFTPFMALNAAHLESVLRELQAIADERGSTPAVVALAWTATRPGVASVLLGASDIGQLTANLAAANLSLSDSEKSRLDICSKPVLPYPASAVAQVLDEATFARFMTGLS
jgi:aryl-alcohol dehydrogenase-like predicted oxidoreductase